MFRGTQNHDLACGIGLFSGPENSDSDYQSYVDLVRLYDKKFYEGIVPVFILVIEKGNPIPNAYWRNQIADCTSNMNNTHKFVMVSKSALPRGVLTALNWIRPHPYEVYVTGNFNKAIAWVKKYRSDADVFYQLYQDLQVQSKAS